MPLDNPPKVAVAGSLVYTNHRPVPGVSVNPPALLKLLPAASTIESPPPVAVILPPSVRSPVIVRAVRLLKTDDPTVIALESTSATAPPLVT